MGTLINDIEEHDWWDDLNEAQLAAIVQAEAELDAGMGIPHSEVLEKYKKWL